MVRWSKRPCLVSGSSVWVKGGGSLLSQLVGGFIGMAVFVFELEEVIAAVLTNCMCLWLVVIEGTSENLPRPRRIQF